MENSNNDNLKEKIDSLGDGMIMNSAGQVNTEDIQERIDKLREAIDTEREENGSNDAATQAAITGDQLEALKRAGYFRKTRPIVRDNKKIGRNDPCPCGAVDENGKPKKYKNCCMNTGKYETTHYD